MNTHWMINAALLISPLFLVAFSLIVLCAIIEKE